MHYLVLMRHGLGESTQGGGLPEPVKAAYDEFRSRAGSAIVAGEALAPSKVGARITGPGPRTVTDGPFPDSAEIVAGFYVLEAGSRDQVLELARGIPAASVGVVEVWPTVEYFPPSSPLTSDNWLALLLGPPSDPIEPGTPEWEASVEPHIEFDKKHGDRLNGGAALHPPATAATVRVRDGDVLVTDGPFAEAAEVAGGFYFIKTADRDEAVKVASQIPEPTVELRRLAGISL